MQNSTYVDFKLLYEYKKHWKFHKQESLKTWRNIVTYSANRSSKTAYQVGAIELHREIRTTKIVVSLCDYWTEKRLAYL